MLLNKIGDLVGEDVIDFIEARVPPNAQDHVQNFIDNVGADNVVDFLVANVRPADLRFVGQQLGITLEDFCDFTESLTPDDVAQLASFIGVGEDNMRQAAIDTGLAGLVDDLCL